MPYPPSSNRFIHTIRKDLRDKGYAYKTEKTYTHWIKRFILFRQKKHPQQLGATRLLQQGYDLRTIQKLLSHSGVKTTEIYTPVLGRGAMGVISPLDS